MGGEASFHLGDEAMLQANLERLREICPGAEFVVASHDPAWTSKQYGVNAVPRPDLSEVLAEEGSYGSLVDRLAGQALQGLAAPTAEYTGPIPLPAVTALAGSDALLISGGGNLNGSWPDQLCERAVFLDLAHRLGIAAVVTGQTLGPHLEARQRDVLRRVLSRATLVGVRERYSLGIARLLGVPSDRLQYQLDDAFIQPHKGPHSRNRPASTDGCGGDRGGWIAVTVTRFGGPLPPLADQLGRLAGVTGCRLVFVPHAKVPDHDVEVARDLVELLDPEIEAEVVPVPSAQRGRSLAENAALVLSMRYHPLVFAVAGGVPALGLYVDEYTRVKLRGALGHAGLEGWVLPVEMVLQGALTDVGLDLWGQRETIRHHLSRQRDRWEAMERAHRRKLVRSLELEPVRELEARDEHRAAAGADAGPVAAPRPQGSWSRLSGATEKRADAWFEERLHLLEQADRALEYALSLEGTLTERDREIEGLKRILASRRSLEADVDLPTETGR